MDHIGCSLYTRMYIFHGSKNCWNLINLIMQNVIPAIVTDPQNTANAKPKLEYCLQK